MARHPKPSRPGTGWMVTRWGDATLGRTGVVHADLECPVLRQWMDHANAVSVTFERRLHEDDYLDDEDWPTTGGQLMEVDMDTERSIVGWVTAGSGWSNNGPVRGWLKFDWRWCQRCGSLTHVVPTPDVCPCCFLTSCDCDN